MALNFYWLKLGAHQLLFDRIHIKFDESVKIRKGLLGLDVSENWQTLAGIRKKIENVVAYKDDLDDRYIRNLYCGR